MTSQIRFCLSAGLLLTILCLSGCVSPNTRIVAIGQVNARAQLREGKASFVQIDINRPMEARAPRIVIQMPDGKVLDRTSFTYPALKQAGFLGPEGKDFEPGNAYSHELSRFGASFYFNQGTLVLIRFTQTTGPCVKFAGERKRVFRSLPLSQDDLENLFGPPDKLSDSYEL